MALTNLGIFHTAIGIIALGAAVVSFIRYGKINLDQLSGKIYCYTTLITSFTALGISKRGGFNPGHVFALFIVVLIIIAGWLFAKRKNSTRARHIENFLLSFSFLLSLVPTVNETFTRVPLGHPLASGPTDPVIAKTLLFLLLLFVIGYVLQFIRQRKLDL